MARTILIATGTPPADWKQLAARMLRVDTGDNLLDPDFDAWLARLQATGDAPAGIAWPGPASLACGASPEPWKAHRQLSSLGEVRYLVFVGNPVDALVRTVDAQDGQSPEAILDAWRPAAAGLVDLAQSEREACLLVSAEDAWRHPGCLVAVLNRWLGGEQLRWSGEPADPGNASGLARAVAALFVQRDRTSLSLYEQLHALCEPLGDVAPDAEVLGFDPRRDLDPHAALQAYRARSVSRQPPDKAVATETDLLRLQLQRVQRELETYYLEVTRLRSGHSLGWAGSGAELSVGGIEFGTAVEDPPHRGLDVCLERLQVGARCLARLRARLVEHHGLPGIAFLLPPGEKPPLSHWVDSGEEGESRYMLLVPGDARSSRSLMHLPRTDWDLVLGVASLLAGHERVPTAWRPVARRLALALAELPPRLRYDDVLVKPLGQEGTFSVKLLGVCHGLRRLDVIELVWCPWGEPVLLLAPPADAHGAMLVHEPAEWSPAGYWPLPLGPGQTRRAKAAAWARLSAQDRALLLAILDAFPAIPSRMNGEADPRLVRAAAALLPDALRATRGRLRLQADRIVGLLSGSHQ